MSDQAPASETETTDALATQATAELLAAGVEPHGISLVTAARILEVFATAPRAVYASVKLLLIWGRNMLIIACFFAAIATVALLVHPIGRFVVVAFVLAWLTSKLSGIFGLIARTLAAAALFVVLWGVAAPIAEPLIDYGLGVMQRLSPATANIIDGRAQLPGPAPIEVQPAPEAAVVPASTTQELAGRVYYGNDQYEFHAEDKGNVFTFHQDPNKVYAPKGWAIAGLSDADDTDSEVWRAQNGEEKDLLPGSSRLVIVKPYP